MLSLVEEIALARGAQKKLTLSGEKIGVIVVESFPALGTLAALRFLEWLQENPEGVVSLPTGKSPQYFIREVTRFIDGWREKSIQRELAEGGVGHNCQPDLRGLHFVQIDEFYPINPGQHNSYYCYVNRYYLKGFGLDPAKAMLINCDEIGLARGEKLEEIWPEGLVDLTLRSRMGVDSLERKQKKVIENIDQWCTEYEGKIRRFGGIGFFLGGIGPDGHIGFNISGSDLYSTTRLIQTNYETQAAAAGDLGGIEVAKKRLVITIGLATITYNTDCTAIIIAAGAAKAQLAADAVERDMHIHYPATILQKLQSSRFYLTTGAATKLATRELQVFVDSKQLSLEQVERVVIDLSLEKRKPVAELNRADFLSNPFTADLLKRGSMKLSEITSGVAERLKEKIEAGTVINSRKIFLHTEPHHDDLMLGYLPYIVRHIREHSTSHYFVTLTSGFTAVTNAYMYGQLNKLRSRLFSRPFALLASENYFEPNNAVYRNRDVWQYLDGVAAGDCGMREDGEARRLLRNLITIYGELSFEKLKERIELLLNYFTEAYPGQKDSGAVQKLKGMTREWEADCLWGYFGWSSKFVRHLRLGFYKGDLFTQDPTFKRDILPVIRLLEEVKPQVITLALDPEGSGPDTHYKVLQAISEALKSYLESCKAEKMEILGYRNVWHRFHPGEADLFVPVSLNMFSLQHSAFENAYISQKEASFPSPAYDGPFSELAQKIQVEQYQMIKTCLGRKYFYEHPSALIRATRGMVFLKRMSPEELFSLSGKLRKSLENI